MHVVAAAADVAARSAPQSVVFDTTALYICIYTNEYAFYVCGCACALHVALQAEYIHASTYTHMHARAQHTC